MEANVITLDIQGPASQRMWVAIFSGPHAEQVRQLFGTDTLPTPFAASTLPYMVFNSVMDRNPGCKVRMRGDSF